MAGGTGLRPVTNTLPDRMLSALRAPGGLCGAAGDNTLETGRAPGVCDDFATLRVC